MAQPFIPTTNYPYIEKLIDSEDFTAINQAFTGAYRDLEKISKEKKGLRKNSDAKMAMKALEQVMELLKELLRIKYRLQQELAAQQKKG